MSAKVRILLVSNGFGEMAILQTIAKAIAARDPSATLAHMPLVGRLGGSAWPPQVGPQAAMPSGGLVTYWNVPNIVRDLGAGLVGLSLSQFAFLRRQRRAYDAVVAVGDAYCAAACLWFAKLPTVVVATAKSERVAPHSWIELRILRGAEVTFARDEPTALALQRGGVRARYAGNAMMDQVAAPEFALAVSVDTIHVALLPGSRSDAPANTRAAARRLLRMSALSGKRVQAFLALAPAAQTPSIAGALEAEGFGVSPRGVQSGVVALASRDMVEIALVRDGLAASLGAADVVLGQAGTGNEQAAGLGKPVVAAVAPGESPQSVGWYRMRQQKLLGDALVVLEEDDDAFARDVLALLADRDRVAAMSAAGRARMGSPGASGAIAQAVLDVAKESSG
ncbi:MAG TPA: lipid-A-disaccharide synthase-related protein [Caldimonas sp.]|nr:lipid-A-disaccharide synthase-related protein [Caldimonas sp.]